MQHEKRGAERRLAVLICVRVWQNVKVKVAVLVTCFSSAGVKESMYGQGLRGLETENITHRQTLYQNKAPAGAAVFVWATLNNLILFSGNVLNNKNYLHFWMFL